MKPAVGHKREISFYRRSSEVIVVPSRVRTPCDSDQSRLRDLILTNLNVGVIVSNPCGVITLANAMAKRLARENPEGKPLRDAPKLWGELFDSAGRHIPSKQWPCMRALRGQTTLGLEYRLVRPDSSACDILFDSWPFGRSRSKANGSLSSLMDISQRKRNEMGLCEDAIQRDRALLAAELHDTVLQGLTAVLLQLEKLELELQQEPEQAWVTLCRVRETARETLSEARRTMWMLSSEPSEPQDAGATLGLLAERIFSGSPMELQLHLGEGPELNSQLCLALVRIGKEAMTNAVKHSRATIVRVELTYRDKVVELAVVDNGRGFARAPLAPSGYGFGLRGLKIRAEQLGGKASVVSQPGQGTKVCARLPFS